jgi:hypothetical protein
MKAFRESWKLFLVYMSFAAFVALTAAAAYFLVRVLPQ